MHTLKSAFSGGLFPTLGFLRIYCRVLIKLMLIFNTNRTTTTTKHKTHTAIMRYCQSLAVKLYEKISPKLKIVSKIPRDQSLKMLSSYYSGVSSCWAFFYSSAGFNRVLHLKSLDSLKPYFQYICSLWNSSSFHCKRCKHPDVWDTISRVGSADCKLK